MTMASRMSSGPLSARNGAKAGEIFVSLVIVVVKNVFSIRRILVVPKSCGGRDNDTPMPYFICHLNGLLELTPATQRCHGLVPWSLTFAATSTAALLKMPRACPVEFHVCGYCSDERETPRDKPVASENRAARL